MSQAEEHRTGKAPDHGAASPKPDDAVAKDPTVISVDRRIEADSPANSWTNPLLGSSPADDPEVAAAAALLEQEARTVVLGDYRLEKRLGVGGFGAVYLAHQISKNRPVALKVLAKSMAARRDFLIRFHREAQTLAKLDHPNIVRGYDLAEIDGWHLFAMEYVDGDSMQTWLHRLGVLTVGDAMHIALRVAAALKYAHDLNLVHRDIKPENILVSRDGQVKVADLGLAKAMDEQDLGLTRSGTGFGTPYYMAPEQALNAKHADHRSDLYALGSTLYHFLAGRHPFRGETALELIRAKERDPLTPIRRLNRDVPERVDLLVAKLLARKPEHRYQSCAELIADIERLGCASTELSFLAEKQSSVETIPAEAVSHAQTQKIVVELNRPYVNPPTRTVPTWWEVTYENSEGKPVIKNLTTEQLEALILDDRIDAKALARRNAWEEFQPLMAFAEFQPALHKRQSHGGKTVRTDGTERLEKVYQECETAKARREALERLRREEEEKRRQLGDHPVVGEVVASIQQAWETDPKKSVWSVLAAAARANRFVCVLLLLVALLFGTLTLRLLVYLVQLLV